MSNFKTILNQFPKTTFNLKVPILRDVVGVLTPSWHVNVLLNPIFFFRKPVNCFFINFNNFNFYRKINPFGVQSHLNKKDWWRLHCFVFSLPRRAKNRMIPVKPKTWLKPKNCTKKNTKLISMSNPLMKF